jgi:hypothetical protein
VNDEVLARTIEYFKGLGLEFSEEELCLAADESKSSINVEHLEERERGVLAAFARKLPGNSEAKRVEILARLTKVLEEVV